MTKKLRDMQEQIENKRVAAVELLNSGDLEGARKMRDEMKNLQESFKLAEELQSDEEDLIAASAKPVKKKDKVSAFDAFVSAFKNFGRESKLDDETVQVLNSTTMTEGVPEDGGLTVPQDIRVEVKELRREGVALEKYVNVEPVSTLTGSRNIEVDADHTPFDNVDEAAEFPEIDGPQFKKIEYKVKKKGGILKVTRELFQDTGIALKGYLVRWLTKKTRATRNFLIIKKLNEITAGEEVEVVEFDDLKDIFNVKLDPAIAATSIVVTNQEGFNYLDKMKNSDGKYVVQPDPVQKSKRLLFGIHPIEVIPSRTMPVVGGKAPIYFGDLNEALTIFDRETMSIEFNDQADSFWKKDITGIKVRERLDIQAVDDEAVVKGLIDAGSEQGTLDLIIGHYNQILSQALLLHQKLLLMKRVRRLRKKRVNDHASKN
ncbi:phage major capsid protein [Enterococcus casseliflavus]|uniref:Phage major capsid protein n=1 Tax=Enterococcus casseliflavus TaxID=37734 RepID=A0A415ENN6_ENTCA|nr:phage major capsid protein [Enterococcus casseliflavus]